MANDVTKLPKWAQDRIRDLERQRDTAIRTLHEFRDAEKPSGVYVEDHACTGEVQGPTLYRHYIQSREVMFEVGSLKLAVRLPWDRNGSDGITLQWEDTARRILHRSPGFVPLSYCRAVIEPARS